MSSSVISGKIGEDLLVRLSGSKPAQHISDRNPHVTDAGAAAALAWLNGYEVLIIREAILASLADERSRISAPPKALAAMAKSKPP